MPETPDAPITSAEEAALFPAKAYRLTGGRLVVVRPWGMETGRLLSPRVAALMEELHGDYSAKGIAKLIRKAQDEVFEIVRLTLGWTREQMNELAFEDLFTLAQAVIEVCLLRGEDAGGIVGKALALATLKRRAANWSASTPPPPPAAEGASSREPSNS